MTALDDARRAEPWPDYSVRVPTGTHVSGPFNSTRFTDCCRLAVIYVGDVCPGCERPVKEEGLWKKR